MSNVRLRALCEPGAQQAVYGGYLQITRLNGFAVGDRVAIAVDDYGPEESRGTIVRLAPDEITILRREPALGEIAVHSSRAGYRIRKEESEDVAAARSWRQATRARP